MKNLRRQLADLWNNDYALEEVMQKAMMYLAVISVILGTAVLLVGW